MPDACIPEGSAPERQRSPRPIVAAAIFCLAAIPGGLWLATPTRPPEAPPGAAAPPAASTTLPQAGAARAALDRVVGREIDRGRLVRANGYAYAIDVGLLALAAALARDRTRYEQLIHLAQEAFILERPPGHDGAVVIWRRRLDRAEPPEASGTTEALQLAYALLVGAELFDRRPDATLALRLLDGYAKHASVDNGIWLIRNYYNLHTRSYATNSFLVDYAPDLLLYASGKRGDKTLRETAHRSARLVRQAQRPNGLIDALVQPEIKTLFSFAIFSPNDVIELEHTALVAEQVVVTAPDVARAALNFARQRIDDLYADYVGRTGTPSSATRADAGTWSALARLAVKLRDREVIEKIRPHLVAHAVTLTERSETFDIHVAAQTLLGLQCLELWDSGASVPRAAEAARLR